MALEGDLRLFKLPDILQMVGLHQKTGILTVQGEQDIIAVSFLHGEIVAADALNQTIEEGLGQVLASQGTVPSEAFAQVVNEHQAGGERLTQLLVARGLLDRRQLLAALRFQTYRLLIDLLHWREGEFKFYAGDEVSYEEGILPISVAELLVRALGEAGSPAGLDGPLPHLYGVYQPQHSNRPIKILGRDGESALEDGSAAWLSPDELKVYEELDGRLAAGDLPPRTGLSEHQVLYGLYRLVSYGLARPAGEVVPAAVETTRRVGAAPPAGAPPAAGLSDLGPTLALAGETAKKPVARYRLAIFHAQAAALFAALFLAVAYLRPQALVLPFPWQGGDRAQLDKQQRHAAFLRIDRSGRTYFLLEGRYPDRLEQLVDLGLLRPADLVDPRGHRLEYLPGAAQYTLRPVGSGGPIEAQGISESITGDFLLDPEFLLVDEGSKTVPLVLLD